MMLEPFIQFCRQFKPDLPGSQTLLAVSGGPDSVVMCHLFRQAGFRYAIAHVNFQLRGEESGRDEAFVRRLAEQFRVKCFVRRFDIKAIAARQHCSVQVAAREIRYHWFDEIAREHGYDFIATAHHRNDLAETFLINLARGTGIAGLHGIPVFHGNIIRPLLFASREQIIEYARENRLDFVEDSSNLSEYYTRNRIRHKIIPEFEKINPSFIHTIHETIDRIGEIEMIYNRAVDEARKKVMESSGDTVRIRSEAFFALEPLKALAFGILSPFGFTAAQIESVIGLQHSIPGKIIASKTHLMVRDRDHLLIQPVQSLDHPGEFEVSLENMLMGIKAPLKLTSELHQAGTVAVEQSSEIAMLDFEKLGFPLVLRKWKRGDAFIPFGMQQRKKLSDYFTDLKYSAFDKQNQWLLCSGDQVAWVVGKRIDDRFKVTPETKKVLMIHASDPY